jgi:hypothetical protein
VVAHHSRPSSPASTPFRSLQFTTPAREWKESAVESPPIEDDDQSQKVKSLLIPTQGEARGGSGGLATPVQFRVQAPSYFIMLAPPYISPL